MINSKAISISAKSTAELKERLRAYVEEFNKLNQPKLPITEEVKEEPGNQSFIIKKAGWEEVSPTKTTNTSILELLQGNYFIDDVYSISANAGEYYAVNPLLSESEWIGEAYAINADDEDVTVTLEASMDETGNMILGVTVPDVFKEDLIIVFKGTDMLFKKALVITPAN